MEGTEVLLMPVMDTVQKVNVDNGVENVNKELQEVNEVSLISTAALSAEFRSWLAAAGDDLIVINEEEAASLLTRLSNTNEKSSNKIANNNGVNHSGNSSLTSNLYSGLNEATKSSFTNSKSNKANYKTCAICHQSLSNREFLQHFKEKHSEVRLGCPKCPKTFDDPDSLNKHYKEQHRYNRQASSQVKSVEGVLEEPQHGQQVLHHEQQTDQGQHSHQDLGLDEEAREPLRVQEEEKQEQLLQQVEVEGGQQCVEQGEQEFLALEQEGMSLILHESDIIDHPVLATDLPLLTIEGGVEDEQQLLLLQLEEEGEGNRKNKRRRVKKEKVVIKPVCDVCEKEFESKRDLFNHKRRKGFCKPQTQMNAVTQQTKRIGIIRKVLH